MKLISTSTDLIKNLDGFKSSHHVPKEINGSSRSFVKKCAEPNLEALLEEVWSRCKEAFAYKRADKTGPLIENGCGTLILPDFKVNIEAVQDEQDPRSVIWRKNIEATEAAVFVSEPFNCAFRDEFSTIEESFSVPQKVEDIIDRVENLESKELTVSYPANCAYCDIHLVRLGIVVHVTNDCYRLSIPGQPTPKILAETIIEFQKSIRSASDNVLQQFSD